MIRFQFSSQRSGDPLATYIDATAIRQLKLVMNNWRWVRHDVVYAVHDMQLAQHGGLTGLRDQNAVLAALTRPEQLDAYGEPPPDAAALAAAYAFGIARNHGLSDGNKRTAWVVARLFLADNGYTLRFNPIDAIRTVEQVTAGNLTEVQLANWFRQLLVGCSR